MKKMLFLALSLLVLTFGLVSCTRNDGTDNSDTTVSQSHTAGEPAPSGENEAKKNRGDGESPVEGRLEFAPFGSENGIINVDW